MNGLGALDRQQPLMNYLDTVSRNKKVRPGTRITTTIMTMMMVMGNSGERANAM